MSGERTITLEFDAEIPQQAVQGQPYALAAQVNGTLTGTVDSHTARLAFDAQLQLPPAELAQRIRENMIGWLRHGVATTFQARLQQPGVDPAALAIDTAWLVQGTRAIVDPVFGAWSYRAQQLELAVTYPEACLAQLPPAVRERLLPPPPEPEPEPAPAPPPAAAPVVRPSETDLEAMEDMDTAAAYGPILRNLVDEIEPTLDPVSGMQVRVRASVQCFFTAEPDRTRRAFNVAGPPNPALLCDLVAKSAEPWVRYAVRQGFFNTLYAAGRQDSAVFSDGNAMQEAAVGLCIDQLKAMGVLTFQLSVRYEAVDGLTAAVLSIPPVE